MWRQTQAVTKVFVTAEILRSLPTRRRVARQRLLAIAKVLRLSGGSRQPPLAAAISIASAKFRWCAPFAAGRHMALQ